MKLLDPSGNEISAEELRKQEEQEQENGAEEVEQPEEPEFAELVRSYDAKMKEITHNILNRANLLDMQLNQKQAYQVVGIVQDAMFNAVFKKLYDLGVKEADEMVDEEMQKTIENIIDFQKNIETYSEEDLNNLNKNQ